MIGFKSWLCENDIVCFVLKGAENLCARRRKTEKSITLALSLKPKVEWKIDWEMGILTTKADLISN
jgi:hypothetical protein